MLAELVARPAQKFRFYSPFSGLPFSGRSVLQSVNARVRKPGEVFEREFIMPDDTTSRGYRESLRIDINEKWELAYWSEKFDVTAEELMQAVREVGVLARDVERHLLRRQRAVSGVR
jgi:hypothetical protein